MKVAVFGVGYVGSVTAACLADSGHQVWGVDVDEAKVDMLTRGRSPVVEPGLDDVVARCVASGDLRATTDAGEALDAADVSLVCVGTPSTPRGSTDLTHVRQAVRDILDALPHVRRSASGLHTIVIRSTVPPGTVDELLPDHLLDALSAPGFSVSKAMCPEFLREGSGVEDFFRPPFVVVGTADPAVSAQLTALFPFHERGVTTVEVRTAEALKYACNAFHATKVSFANEMGRMFRLLDVDSREVMDLFCTDTALNISPRYLRPGFAFGGSCLPKDVKSLLHMARMRSADMPLLAGTLASNELVVHDVVDRVVATGGRTIALLGLSFKSATDDLRDSPSVELAERLVGKGFELRIFDALVNPTRLVGSNRRHVESKLPHLRRLFTETPGEALHGADIALVSATEQVVVDALLASPPPMMIDLSGRLGTPVEALAGYEGVGW